MHYRARGFTVRSENAAKSPLQHCSAVACWIQQNVHVRAAMDYGCGRLRYAEFLAQGAERLVLVDSEEQLGRAIAYRGGRSSIRDIAVSKWPTCEVFSTDDVWRGLVERYDFILCANVLSAIPSRRIQNTSIRAIGSHLSRHGQVLVVNQHTNSYFTAARRRPDAIPHLDGWILPSRGGAAYYGVLTRDKVVRMLQGQGLRVRDAWIEGQSNWVLAELDQ